MEPEIKQEYGEVKSACKMQGNHDFTSHVNAMYHAPSDQGIMGLSEQYYLQPAESADVAAMNGLPYPASMPMHGMPPDMGHPGDGRDPPMFVRYSIEQGESEMNSKCLPKKYKCGMCIYKTSYKSDLNRHLKKHNMDHSYRCHLCNMPFKTPGNVYNHMRNMHFNEMQFLQCQQCAYVAMDEAAIRKHILTCHGGVVDTTAGAVSVLSENHPATSQASPGYHPVSPAIHGYHLGPAGADARQTYPGFSSSHDVGDTPATDEISTTVGRNSTETSSSLSKPEIVIDVDESGRGNPQKKTDVNDTNMEVDLVSDDETSDGVVASIGRMGNGEHSRKQSSGSTGEREEFQRPLSSQEKPGSGRGAASSRSTPEVLPSPSQSSSTPGSACQSPHLTSPPAEAPRPSSGSSDTSTARADTRVGQIERQSADTTGRPLSSPVTSKPTTTTSPVTKQPALQGPDGSGVQSGQGLSSGSMRGPWMRTEMSPAVSSSRPPSVIGQAGESLRRRFHSLKAARQSVSRAADSLRGRSFVLPRRQQCEGCREFFHTPQFLARHRAQCPAFIAQKSKNAMVNLSPRVPPMGPGRFHTSGMSPSVSPAATAMVVQGTISPDVRQRAEDGAVTNAPPSSGRYAKLVSDFDNFASRPFACSLCFFRSANVSELVQHVDNHLTGCNTVPVPDTARFSVSWSNR